MWTVELPSLRKATTISIWKYIGIVFIPIDLRILAKGHFYLGRRIIKSKNKAENKGRPDQLFVIGQHNFVGY